MIDVNEWLEKNYPQNQNGICQIESLINNDYGKRREEVVSLDLNLPGILLTGSLDLSDFVNLKYLRCRYNKLTEIIIPFLNKIESIDVRDNEISSFNFNFLNPETLKALYVYNNNILETNIRVFRKLINLEDLDIGCENYYLMRGKRNRFFGSLEYLKDLKELKFLDISNTNVDRGLEYLSESLKDFTYNFFENYDLKVKEVEKILKNQVGFFENYDKKNWEIYLNRWKKINFQKVKLQSLILELEKLRFQQRSGNELNEKLNIQISFLERQIKEAEFFIARQKEEIYQSCLNSFTKTEQTYLKELISTHKKYWNAKRNCSIYISNLIDEV